jgi:hypothetical protein
MPRRLEAAEAPLTAGGAFPKPSQAGKLLGALELASFLNRGTAYRTASVLTRSTARRSA